LTILNKKKSLSNLSGEVLLIVLLLTGCSKANNTSDSKVTDIDGNEYNTITIGT